MKIFLGADHGGFELKEKVKEWLEKEKHEVKDVGAEVLDKDDDFVDYALLVAEGLVEDLEARGILFCRNGFGMVIAANRIGGVRCGFGSDEKMVEKGRSDDDINCLSIPADYLDFEEVKKVIKVFIEKNFSGKENYRRRLWKLEMIGGGGCCGGGGCGGGCSCGSC